MMGVFVTGGAGHAAYDLRFIRRLLSLGVATKASGSSLAHQHLRCGLILRLVQGFRHIARHIGHESGAAFCAFGREGSEPRCLGPAPDGEWHSTESGREDGMTKSFPTVAGDSGTKAGNFALSYQENTSWINFSRISP